MNRTERLYALVEELRGAGPGGRTARQLARHFEVSVRTIERDLSALGQAGVPLATKVGRAGGYSLDRSMTLPPLNFTSLEAAAVAIALSRNEHVMFNRDARSALQKIVAAIPEWVLADAYDAAARVQLIMQPVPDPDPAIAETIWAAVRNSRILRITYIAAGGVETIREVEPAHVVVGPNGSYLTAWCRLRDDDRVFRMDRITDAEPVVGVAAKRPVTTNTVLVDGHVTRLPAQALLPEKSS